MKFSTRIVNSLTQRWTSPARLLGLALGFGVLFAALAIGTGSDSLWVTKLAYNDAGQGGTVSGNVVTDMVPGVDFGDGITTPASNKIVPYAISYGPGTVADPSTLGGLTFDDSMSQYMTMVGPVQVPTSWTSIS